MLYQNKQSKTNYNVSKTNYLLQFFSLTLVVITLTLLLYIFYIFINLIIGILVKSIDPERGMILRDRITSFSDNLTGTDKELTEHASKLWEPFSEHNASPLVYSTDKELTEYTSKLWEPFSKHNAPPLMYSNEEYEQNAFVAPGGFIFITKGLLSEIKYENELSFVMCHELGHIMKRHVQKRLGTSIILRIFSMAGGYDSLLFFYAGQMAISRFNRQDDYKADEFALTCLNTYYGHTNGATHFFERIKNLEYYQYENYMPEYMQTHPNIDNRMSRILDLVKQKGFKDDLPLKPLTIPLDD